MELSKENLLDMYKKMVAIREFEQSLADAVKAGSLPGFVHLGVGQEAVMVGVASALRATDWISSTHREHGMLIARGANMGRLRAEIFGKADGYCKGKGGSMHLAVYEKCLTGCNGILGPSQTINNGIALAMKKQGKGDIAVVMFGDGAAQRGEFHEALNLAALWELPALAICVNNGYGISVSFGQACPVDDIASRAASYGMPGLAVDGCDVMGIYEAVSETAKTIRAGKGPALIELKTCRWCGHFEGDPQLYRPAEEFEEGKKRDPIARLAKQLVDQGIATGERLQGLRGEVDRELREAIAFAEKSDFPSADEIYADLFCQERRQP